MAYDIIISISRMATRLGIACNCNALFNMGGKLELWADEIA